MVKPVESLAKILSNPNHPQAVRDILCPLRDESRLRAQRNKIHDLMLPGSDTPEVILLSPKQSKIISGSVKITNDLDFSLSIAVSQNFDVTKGNKRFHCFEHGSRRNPKVLFDPTYPTRPTDVKVAIVSHVDSAVIALTSNIAHIVLSRDMNQSIIRSIGAKIRFRRMVIDGLAFQIGSESSLRCQKAIESVAYSSYFTATLYRFTEAMTYEARLRAAVSSCYHRRSSCLQVDHNLIGERAVAVRCVDSPPNSPLEYD